MKSIPTTGTEADFIQNEQSKLALYFFLFLISEDYSPKCILY